MSLKLEGTYTALVTPFKEDESIDWDAFARLIESQVAGGITGVVPCGTTGESPALTESEQLELVTRTVKLVAGRMQVIAGTGSNSTKHAVHLTEQAVKAGVDGVMVVVPYYNKPTPEGLVFHFVTVAKAAGKPVILYNIPGRTGIDLTCDTLLSIADRAPNVCATKEATGNVLRAQEVVRRSQGKITVLSGDDALTLPMVAVGAKGVISVTSNLLPKDVADATRLALAGDLSAARAAHQRLLPVHDAMFLEANPGPVKAALAQRGAMRDTVRGPLVPVKPATRERVLAILGELK
jgi:4-hydroxy-tetrahydrodipicolinate synthase